VPAWFATHEQRSAGGRVPRAVHHLCTRLGAARAPDRAIRDEASNATNERAALQLCFAMQTPHGKPAATKALRSRYSRRATRNHMLSRRTEGSPSLFAKSAQLAVAVP
jgi:hypothetical protein